MANYMPAVRSSYFRVKDREKFQEWFDTLLVSDDGLELWTKAVDTAEVHQKYASDPEEEPFELIAFGGYTSWPCERMIVKNDGDDGEGDDFDDCEEIDFTKELQEHIHEDWSVILQEVGYEKLRYLVGFCTIVDSENIEWIDLTNWAVTTIPDGSKFTSPEY